MAQPEAQQSDAATDKMAAAAVAATPNGISHGKPAAPAAAPAAADEHNLEAYRRREQEALRFIETVTSNAQAVQDEVLAAILTRNANTEYLQRHGLAGRTDKDAFRRLLPSITYEDLQPEIQRIANGDTSPILSSHPISEFLTSSGTSAGERKLMPTISEEFERRTLLYSLLMPVMNQYLPDLHKGKGMFFLFIRPEAKTPGGLLARPVLTSYYKSPYFTNRPYDPYNVLTSPNEVVLCPDAHQTMYCHLMCGLLQRHQVLRMGAVFASGFIRAIRFLEEHWRELVADMRAGVLSERLVTDGAARQAVQALMDDDSVSMRDVADAVERHCGGGDWRGIITRLWPNAKYIEVVITGTMAQYIPTLDYYSGGLPLASTMYASSECYFGINLKPLCSPSEVTYTLLPNMCYYEFLPVTRGGAGAGDVDAAASFKLQQHSESAGDQADVIEQQLVELQDVQVGREYELLLTTYAGLYRYRVGDVLRCTGFHNAAPQFHFVCRKNVVLSIDADKTDEQDLHAAVDAAARAHLHPAGARLIEYTSYADTTSSIPGHYVLYWELRYDAAVDAVVQAAGAPAAPGAATAGAPTPTTAPAAPAAASAELLHACAHTVEEALDVIYRAGRCEGSIGPLVIKVVKPGTFDALMDYALSRGASINQYKTPRCVKFNPIVELLNARVAASYSALTLPHWLSHRP